MSFHLLGLAWVSLMFRNVFADESLFLLVDDLSFLESEYPELGPVSSDPYITALANEQEFGPELGFESDYLGLSFPSTHSEDLFGSNNLEDLFGSNNLEDLFGSDNPQGLFGSDSPEDLFGSNIPEDPFVPDPTLLTAIDDLGAQTPLWDDQGGLVEVTSYNCAHIGNLHALVCASGNPNDNTAHESLNYYTKLEFSILITGDTRCRKNNVFCCESFVAYKDVNPEWARELDSGVARNCQEYSDPKATG